ncbi:MAG: type I-C CRISPR-associated protein Cas5c [Clostridia bacterium]|nr:type I-C CRISPR-associated protein Cas5c [Clostridia bacterium]
MLRNQVEFSLRGRYALFSDPVTRTGGEKFSYQVPTYQALKGVCESIYWKPTFIWVVDEVRVMNAIRTESKNIRPINYQVAGNDLSIYTYLSDVCYQVRAHFVWNLNRDNLAEDRNEHKHHNIARRMIDRGGRRDVFLGTRECQGYIEPCAFGEGESFYDRMDGGLDFGLMFHGFDYPDETGHNMLAVRFWRPRMEKGGIIRFTPPEKCDPALKRDIRPMSMKDFGKGNFTGLREDSLIELSEEGGETIGLGTETV